MLKVDEAIRNKILDNILSIVKPVRHAILLLRSTHPVHPRNKKYMLFQFLLELGMSNTNLSDNFLAWKWSMPFDEEICWGL